MSIKYNMIKALIVQKGMKQQDVADLINMDRTTFNVKLNRYNNRDFTLSEAKSISDCLKEPIDKFF